MDAVFGHTPVGALCAILAAEYVGEAVCIIGME